MYYLEGSFSFVDISAGFGSTQSAAEALMAGGTRILGGGRNVGDSAITLSTRLLDFDLCLRIGRGLVSKAKAAHTLDVQCTPCKHDVPKLDETCQCMEVSVLSTPCIAWHDGNQDRFDFRRAVPPAAVPSCKCVDQSRATC
ncbi:hypothetical protein J6590_049820 [Homalodisca vitripennis]|nr:hypothetical protein J6590_049820 [Homalodisca vitripennis]